jgi:peptide deformylase
MALLTILEHPDPRLRLHAEPVTRFDAGLSRLVDDLLETLYASNAIGLCAQQAHDLRQVIVMDLSGTASAPQVYINPQVLTGSRMGMVEESCLSVPGVVASVARHTRIRVRAQDRAGEYFERDLEGMDAVCLQHEMDHLVGKLFVDRLSWLRRQWLRWSQQRASA